ncbi:hypothetical protein EJB05_38354, partial [Eragrostis curvula]
MGKSGGDLSDSWPFEGGGAGGDGDLAEQRVRPPVETRRAWLARRRETSPIPGRWKAEEGDCGDGDLTEQRVRPPVDARRAWLARRREISPIPGCSKVEEGDDMAAAMAALPESTPPPRQVAATAALRDSTVPSRRVATEMAWRLEAAPSLLEEPPAALCEKEAASLGGSPVTLHGGGAGLPGMRLATELKKRRRVGDVPGPWLRGGTKGRRGQWWRCVQVEIGVDFVANKEGNEFIFVSDSDDDNAESPRHVHPLFPPLPSLVDQLREMAKKRGKGGDEWLARFGITPSTSLNPAPLLVKEADNKPMDVPEDDSQQSVDKEYVLEDDSQLVDDAYVLEDDSQPVDGAYVLEDDSQVVDDDDLLLHHESQDFCATRPGSMFKSFQWTPFSMCISKDSCCSRSCSETNRLMVLVASLGDEDGQEEMSRDEKVSPDEKMRGQGHGVG